jgi:DNA-binding transcriptional MerR regulator
MKKRLFTQGEVNKIFEHIPSRTTRFWGESGLVEWSGEHADRRGLHREYALENLWQLGLAEELMSLNLPVKHVERLMARVSGKLLSKIPEAWNKYTLIINKINRMAKEEHEDLDVSGKKAIITEKIPGFHMVQLVKTAEIDNMWNPGMKKLFGDSLLVIMVNLQNIVDKVDYYIKKAGV